MKFKVEDFNIEQIAESGQCFRWNKIGELEYRGIIGNNVCEVKQVDDEIYISGISETDFINYFDIEREYGNIKEFYANDKVLNEAMKHGFGIRILTQNKFETLISFIISANNNIPRIKKSVEAISRRFGKRIKEEFYAFPTVEELSRATESDLKECGVGFRAKYIVNTCKSILEGFDLEEVSKLPLN